MSKSRERHHIHYGKLWEEHRHKSLLAFAQLPRTGTPYRLCLYPLAPRHSLSLPYSQINHPDRVYRLVRFCANRSIHEELLEGLWVPDCPISAMNVAEHAEL